MLQSESRRLYSWWWDSHNSPKNSKWLQENLTDMDVKVKAMIKLIEEDADSFARRAEMYYKKRPELIKLVEEFYRAYRALAERYNHATGELRHAHQTMAKAFPSEVPFELADDSPLGSSDPEAEPHTPEMSHPIRAWLGSDDLWKGELSLSSEPGLRKKGLKQLKEMFDSSEKEQSSANENAEVQALKKALDGIEAEKEEVLLQYQQCSEKLSNLEGELNRAQEDARKLDGESKKADMEIQALKEALSKSEAERDAALLQHRLCLERISKLEIMISLGQQQSIKAEGEAQNLKHELSRLEAEKETGLAQYKQCLEKISVLENEVSLAEKDARVLTERAEKAEAEAESLKQALCKASEETEYVNLQHVKCLETISKLESDISCAQEDAKRLANEILIGVTKLVSAEEQCALLERLNQSLRSEAENLARKIAIKDRELSEKHEELKKVQVRAKDEQSRFVHIEDTLQMIQNLHSQSQEEQRTMASELRDGFQMLKDLEIRRHGLEEEVRQVKEENQGLSALNLASEASITNLQDEIIGLKETKRKLEEEIERRVDQSNAVQEEICRLKEEIKGLNVRYWALIEQVESVGLNPDSLGSLVKDLRDENSNLKEMCKKNQDEKEAMLEKLENMEKFSTTNAALEGEKSALVAEKDSLFSQLQLITVNLEEILEKNTLLENSLSGANAELEGLKIKSTSLEQSCKFLDDEKLNLLDERGTLVSQLENVEQRLEDLEKRFIALEEKYAGLEKENESTLGQVGELRTSLGLEKQEHASFAVSSGARLADLENHVRLLQEESKWKKKEFEEDLDRSMNSQFEIFILQKLLRDMEDRNFSLLIECENLVEAAKFSEKFVLELQREDLEKQVEIEFLFDEIQMMRRGINQVFNVLEANGDEIEKEEIPISCILRSIEEMKCSKQKILVENSVLLTLLEQMRLEKIELESGKETLEQDLKFVDENLEILTSEKHGLLEVNEKLKVEVSNGHHREELLEAEIDSVSMKHADLRRAFLALQGENLKLLEVNESLSEELSNLKEEKCTLERENNDILQEASSFSNLTSIFMSYGSEKSAELSSFHDANNELKSEVEKLGKELSEVKGSNGLLNRQVLVANEFLNEKEMKLSEAEERLKAKETTVEELERECEASKLSIHELSDCSVNQKMEIECLREMNGELEAELEECRIREENLTLELQERSNVSELWEAEAAGFYFDLQVSNISEIVFKGKVHELSDVCETLSYESAWKSIEMEQMKERVSFLESENEGLKAHMLSYIPIIESLGNSVASLEHNARFRTQGVAEYQGEKVSDFSFHLHEKIRKELDVDRIEEVPDGIPDLQKLQTRVEAVEKAVVEERERLALTESSTSIIKLEAAMKSKDVSSNQRKYIHKEERKLGKIAELRIGVHMKDILLDQVSNGPFNGLSDRMKNHRHNNQMLELWESGEKNEAPKSEKELSVDKLEVSPSIKERTNEGKRRKILERLTSDSQKLRTLQATVHDLKRKAETIKKSNKKAKNAEQEMVKGQLREAEEAIMQLVGMNGELVNTIEVGPSSFNEKVLVDSEEAGNLQRKRVSEQARKGSEKIGRLQLEVEKIQYVLLKLEVPKKSRFRLSESRTSVLLRNFVYNGGRSNNGRQQKKALCGCFRPSGSNGVSHNY